MSFVTLPGEKIFPQAEWSFELNASVRRVSMFTILA